MAKSAVSNTYLAHNRSLSREKELPERDDLAGNDAAETLDRRARQHNPCIHPTRGLFFPQSTANRIDGPRARTFLRSAHTNRLGSPAHQPVPSLCTAESRRCRKKVSPQPCGMSWGSG